MPNNKKKRNALWIKQGGKCATCGGACRLPGQGKTAHDTFTLDHIIPKSMGGTNGTDNLQGMCRRCNTMKGADQNFFIQRTYNPMPYKITITKVEPNPTYQQELTAFKEAEQKRNMGGWATHVPEPIKEIEQKKLETVLTDAEFDTVRKSCLGLI